MATLNGVFLSWEVLTQFLWLMMVAGDWFRQYKKLMKKRAQRARVSQDWGPGILVPKPFTLMDCHWNICLGILKNQFFALKKSSVTEKIRRSRGLRAQTTTIRVPVSQKASPCVAFVANIFWRIRCLYALSVPLPNRAVISSVLASICAVTKLIVFEPAFSKNLR